ncbi:DEAD-domain-containing protein [Gigaspora margarita]|uniref:RNA helicase n=1 Tax=Gigaspora margarita TaxID=4874 RepID=A0A8H4ETV0_GIGMA|nr:DEAD-domain-containing protein [Gigaspora margarita]
MQNESEIQEVQLENDIDLDISSSLTKEIEDEDLSEEDDEVIISKQLQAKNRKKKKSGGFQSMGLSYPVYKAILHKGFKVPTPIQRKSIPLIMDGKDVVGMARTGSGKTAAFLIPIIEKLRVHSAKVGARAIILSPSRELAIQTQKVCKELTKYTDLRTCLLVGGDSLEDQFAMFANNPDIIVATPGRFLHLIIEMELELKTVEYIVFDEADRLFELGFSAQLHEILNRLPQSRQTMLFSATLPKSLVEFANAGLQDPSLVRLDTDTKISTDLMMAFFSVKQLEKEAALLYLLYEVIKIHNTPTSSATISNNKDDNSSNTKSQSLNSNQTIIFVSTKHHVEYITNLLNLCGFQTSYIYGSLDQTARKIQINNFRNGRTNILVVTDVAARGIDIPILENVINYDFIDSSKMFVHRVGRTARAGRKGWAYSLITPEELPYLLDLQLFLGRRLLFGSATNSTPDYTSDIIIGFFPHDPLGSYVEWVKGKQQEINNLKSLCDVAKNGYKLFCKSKSSASPESYKRAKKVIEMNSFNDVHILFADQVNAQEKNRLCFINSISNFRPNETIFEIGNRGKKKTPFISPIVKQRKETAVKTIIDTNEIKIDCENTPNSHETEIKSQNTNEIKKRKNDDDTNMSKKQKKENFRDEEYYISHYQKDANTEKGYSVNQGISFAEESKRALLGTQNDEQIPAANKKKSLKWDNKKKNFVRGNGIGSDNKKFIISENGTKIPATYKSGRFTEWQQQHKLSIPRTGEKEISSARLDVKKFRHKKTSSEPSDPFEMDYEKKQQKTSKKANSRNSVKAKNEIKTIEQICKQRRIKEKRKAKNARPSRKARLKK